MSKLEKFMRTGHPDLVMAHLDRIKKPEVVALALNHHEELVRMTVFPTFERIGKPAIPIIVKALEHEDPDVRGDAVETLGRIGNLEVLPALEKALKTEQTEFVRRYILAAMYKLKKKSSG
ncbi:MAG TPA: HEAT repeat domain-containing protein [Candidatus Norongarragalinales archaeon]|jgi:HEAT repeat protein|nr:HEAT repeat domain-containing protein [Candidatus Norongarragalinales archaeon]